MKKKRPKAELTNVNKSKKLALVNSPDLAEWCAVLSSAAVVAEPVPPGWMTVMQIAQQLGKSRAHVSHQIQAAYKAGSLERKIFSVVTGDKVYPVPHYRVKK